MRSMFGMGWVSHGRRNGEEGEDGKNGKDVRG